MFISPQTAPEIISDLWDKLENGLPWRGEIIHRKKDGNTFWQLMSVVPLYDENGAINQYAVIGENITRRKLVEQEMERLAITDPLTGLFNRRHFFSEAQKIFLRGNHAPMSWPC